MEDGVLLWREKYGFMVRLLRWSAIKFYLSFFLCGKFWGRRLCVGSLFCFGDFCRVFPSYWVSLCIAELVDFRVESTKEITEWIITLFPLHRRGFLFCFVELILWLLQISCWKHEGKYRNMGGLLWVSQHQPLVSVALEVEDKSWLIYFLAWSGLSLFSVFVS